MFEFLQITDVCSISKTPSLPAQAAPAPLPAAGAAPPALSAARTGDIIHVPFSDIMAGLPALFLPLVSSSVTGTFPLPVQTALAQLPSGAVRIPLPKFANQPRRERLPTTFATTKHWSICRLPKILAAMNPALLSRRTGQTQVEAPQEISGLFAVESESSAPFARPAGPSFTAPPVPVRPTGAFCLQKPAAPASPPAPSPAGDTLRCGFRPLSNSGRNLSART